MLTADVALLPALRPESGPVAGSGQNVILFNDLLNDEVGNIDVTGGTDSFPFADLIAQVPLANVPQLLQDAGYEVPAELTQALSADGKASPLPGKTLPNDLLQLIQMRLADLVPSDEAARPLTNSASEFASVHAEAALNRRLWQGHPPTPGRVETDRDSAQWASMPTAEADVAQEEFSGDAITQWRNVTGERNAQSTAGARGESGRADGITRHEPGSRFDRTLSELAKVLVPSEETQVVPAKSDDSFFDVLLRDFEGTLRADANAGSATNASSPAASAANSPLVATIGDAPVAATATRPARGELFLNPDLANPQWPSALAERVTFAINEKFQQADLRLNPPQLGQIELRISLVQDQASVSFSSQHVAVREAIEAALPRLREALADAGLNLVNVDVSDRSLAQDRRHSHPEQDRPRATQYFAEFDISAEAPSVFGVPEGRRIDYFA